MQNFKTTAESIAVTDEAKSGSFYRDLSKRTATRINAFRTQVQPGPMILAEIMFALEFFRAIYNFFHRPHITEEDQCTEEHMKIETCGFKENSVKVHASREDEIEQVLATYFKELFENYPGEMDFDKESKTLMTRILRVYDDDDTAYERALVPSSLATYIEDEEAQIETSVQRITEIAEKLNQVSCDLFHHEERNKRMWKTVKWSIDRPRSVMQVVEDVKLGKRKFGEM